MADEVQQIKDKLNIAEVVGQYVPLRRAGRSLVGRCPFHKERTPSFHVSAERGTYKCFGCGEGGDIFSFVQKIENSDFPAVLKQLAERAGVKLERRFVRPAAEVEKSERLMEACEKAADFFKKQLYERSDVLDYLSARGLTKESIEKWNLGYAPASWEELSRYLISLDYKLEDIVDAGLSVKSEKRQGQVFDRFRGRIMFPISDSGGRTIAFSARFFEKVRGQKEDIEPAKYINSPETLVFKKSKTLYGYPQAMPYIRKFDCALLVEGQFDLIMAHQVGLPFTIALSGTALTEEHLARLSRLSKRLVLALDADPAGLRSGLKSSLMAIEEGFDVKIPAFPHGQDPASLAQENPELLKAAVRTSKTAVEFFLEALRVGVRDERAYKRTVEAQVLPLIAAMESKIDQAHFCALVAARLGVPEEAVRTEVTKRARTPNAPSLDIQQNGAELSVPALTPFERKVGMLLFRFPEGSPIRMRLSKVVEPERLGHLEQALQNQAETLRFCFDRELGEFDEEAIAADMLAGLERSAEKERFKRRFS